MCRSSPEKYVVDVLRYITPAETGDSVVEFRRRSRSRGRGAGRGRHAAVLDVQHPARRPRAARAAPQDARGPAPARTLRALLALHPHATPPHPPTHTHTPTTLASDGTAQPRRKHNKALISRKKIGQSRLVAAVD